MTAPLLQVSLEAYLSNLKLLLEHSSCTAMTPVIKADAYGHGAVALARAAESEFETPVLPFFCVARLNEAEALRSAGIKRPIAILSEDCVAEFGENALDEIVFFVSTKEDVRRILALKPESKNRLCGVVFHLNTGMNRLGFDCCGEEELESLFACCAQLLDKGVKICGFSSHLACAEENPSVLSQKQAALFETTLQSLRKKWATVTEAAFPSLIMLSNSAGSVWRLSPSETCIRPGILSYGLFSDEQTRKESLLEHPHLAGLRAIANLKVPVRQIRRVKAGDSISYGHRYRCESDKILAILSYGYADGLCRSLSVDSKMAASGPRFFLRGEACPIVGRVTMDMVLVDLTEHSQVDQLRDDLVAGHVIWADWISPQQTAEWQASSLGTISYEILCNVGARVIRDYKA